MKLAALALGVKMLFKVAAEADAKLSEKFAYVVKSLLGDFDERDLYRAQHSLAAI